MKVKLFFVEDKKPYLVNDDNFGVNEECLFVINNGGKKEKDSYCVGYFDDLLGVAIKRVYKVIANTKQIGLKYIKNKQWPHEGDYFCLTDVKQIDLKKIVKNGGDCEIE